MQASAPSRMALATSVTSARVGRPRVLHAVEHLRGDDHRLLMLVAGGDDPLLHDRHLGHVDLDAQVAAGHHHAVGFADDGLEARRSLPAFRSWRSRGPPSLARAAVAFSSATSLARRTKLRPTKSISFSAAQIAWRRSSSSIAAALELHAGQVDALAAADHAALHDSAKRGIGLFGHDFHADRAVGQQHAVANSQLIDERRVGRRQFAGLLGLAADEAKFGVGAAIDRSAGELAEPNLGSRQVDQHGQGTIHLTLTARIEASD